jgi:hypothetical protein
MNDEDLKQIAKVVKWMADTGNGTDYCQTKLPSVLDRVISTPSVLSVQ